MSIQDIGQIYMSAGAAYWVFCFISCEFTPYECFAKAVFWPIFVIKDAWTLLRRKNEDG